MFIMTRARLPRILAVLASVSGLVIATGVVAFTIGKPADGNWAERLAVCARSTVDLRVDCYEQVYFAAYESDAIAAFNADLEVVERDNPETSEDCHTGGHQAGRRAASSGNYTQAVLGGASSKNLCGNGFIHGAFDELAHQKASLSTYLELTKVCDNFDPAVRYAACVDGYGHSAWISTRNLSKGIDLCLLFTELESRKVCLSGILMQMYRIDPYTGAPAVMSVERADEVCGEVEAKTGNIELVKTCRYEAVWPLGLEAGGAAQDMLEDRPAGVATWMPPAELLEKTKKLYLEAFNTCEEQGEWADICREKIARSPVWRVAGDKQVNAAICEVFPGRFNELCVSEARFNTQAPAQP